MPKKCMYVKVYVAYFNRAIGCKVKMYGSPLGVR